MYVVQLSMLFTHLLIVILRGAGSVSGQGGGEKSERGNQGGGTNCVKEAYRVARRIAQMSCLAMFYYNFFC